ncbi:MAG: hypothetical protein ACLQMF_07625 [Rectinemataceae bacterium]
MNEGGKKRSGARGAGRILKELLDILPRLDEEGLAFLLEQARVHLYNMEAERLDREAESASAGAASAPEKRSGMRLERSADGRTYHVVAGGKWKMFSAEEIAALVRITRSGEEGGEVARRVYAWLDRERGDALDDLGIGKPPSPALAELVRMLLASFPGHRSTR